ncbi:hypothetical protein JZ751_009648 [Albula glossodonta]|uniref:Uncharacterized protein n=1 Tax=Albula glossodonta TaxID=121402 RepID=A0A8T2P918_9TELE|nr:hypothetical protein JZ751_009648 [Albula glossodonta]
MPLQQTILCLLFIIISISNRLNQQQGKKRCDTVPSGRCEKLGKAGHSNSPKQHLHKWDMGEKDLKLLATILSAGLVDADPTYLKHMKEYRDLRGGHT